MLILRRRTGFTLVEVLLVILILLTISVVAYRILHVSMKDTRRAALEADLHIMNGAIERYRLEHDFENPGTIGGTTSWDNFVTHMTTETDKNGDPGIEFGPYLKMGIPKNPYNGSNSGALYELPLAINATIGWYYDADNGLVRENVNAKTLGAEASVEASVEPIVP